MAIRIFRYFARSAGIVWRKLLASLPDIISVRFRPEERRFRLSDVPHPVRPRDAEVRLLIAPVNFAAQGFQWSRAAELLVGVSATCMQRTGGTGYGFPVDYTVDNRVFSSSGDWARAQRQAVANGFSHVLIEAELPIFGLAFDGFVDKEVRWLKNCGVQVAAVSHGTDLRLPSRHAGIDEWSPFTDSTASWVERLQAKAIRNREILTRMDVPVFVATPDLLLDWPEATWLPTVVDPAAWATLAPVLRSSVPQILHAPTNPEIKGTHLIEPVLHALENEGIIKYSRLSAVSSDQMPARYESSDIVIDQVRIGAYGLASVEAMAAGRIVIAHLHEQVREHIRNTTGLCVPIVEATPQTLASVLRDIVTRPQYYRDIARRGPEYVEVVHNGNLSSEVLRGFLRKGDSD